MVSAPRDGSGGVFQYDFGKTIQNQTFEYTGYLNQPPVVLRTAVNGLKAKYESDGHGFQDTIARILDNNTRLEKKGYGRPGRDSDKLYTATM